MGDSGVDSRLSLSIDALAYEMVNKCFRNAVVIHVRSQLAPVFGERLDAEVANLYVKEWDQITQSSTIAKQRGLSREIIDNLDLLSVNHFPALFDKFFVQIIPTSSLPSDPAAQKRMRTKVKELLGTVKDVRNPNAHPPEQDLPIYDALHLAHAAHLLLENFLEIPQAAANIEEIRKELIKRTNREGGDDPVERATGLASLPPREEMFDHFVGRTSELEDLWQWFTDDSRRRWVLVGDGGKGKSTIAYQFALSVYKTNLPGNAAVVWMSAKRRKFEDSETRVIAQPDFWDLDSALDCLLRAFGAGEDLGKSINARIEATLQLLRDFPSLIVVDDIDSIDQQNEEVVEFFQDEVTRTSSKVLFTSRRMYPGFGRSSTVITGLTKDDAAEFAKMTSKRLGLVDTGRIMGTFAKIFDATEGSPLYIEDFLRLCRQLSVGEALDRWKQGKGDAARRYALEREYSLLGSSAQGILDATSWAKMPLSLSQIALILGLSEDDSSAALDELTSRFLVSTPEVIDGVPAFRAHRNLEVLRRREIQDDPAKLPLRSAVEAVLKPSVSRGVSGDLARQVSVRLRSGRERDALEIVESALAKQPAYPPLLALRAEVLSRHQPPRMTDARLDWQRASELGLVSREAFVRWAEAEGRVEDWRRMYAATALGLQRTDTEDAHLCGMGGYAASRIGQQMVRGLDRESGFEWLDRAEALLRTALKSGRLRHANESRMGSWFRALIVNATAMESSRRDQQVVFWVLEWLSEFPESPEARREAARQSSKYASIRTRLASLGEP